MSADIGLIGIAVMGENLVLNLESKGFTVAVFNRTGKRNEKRKRLTIKKISFFQIIKLIIHFCYKL